MKLQYPRMVVKAKKPYAYSGNRLNGIFLSTVMSDNDSVRKLIHEQEPHAQKILTALYNYHQNRDKQALIDTIRPLTKNCGDFCGIGVGTDKNGKQIITDWSTGHSSDAEESLWADLSLYDEKHTINIFDEMGNPRRCKLFENVSVAEVLADTIHNRNCYIEHCPQTGDEKLDILLKNIWQVPEDEQLPQQTYYRAVKKMNQNLISAFLGNTDADARKYMPAIILLDNKSSQIFDNIGYREQFGFYKSKMGQELLKFSYLTTLSTMKKFDKEDFNNYLNDVKSSGLWQIAQYKITNKLINHKATGSLLNQRLLSLNYIRRPQSKMYQDYYQTDLERMNYMNWYLPKDQKQR